MNQNQHTPTDTEAAMIATLEAAANMIAPPWALPLTLDDVDPNDDDGARDVFYSSVNYGEDIEGDVIVRLSQVLSFDERGNLVERGEVEPFVHIEPSRHRAFTSTELMAICLAVMKLHEVLTADEVE